MLGRIATLCLCLCLAASGGLAVAGCGSDSKKSKSSKSKKKKKKSKPAAGGMAVTMQNISFNPSSLSVKAGDTVTWTNEESAAHDVTAEDGSFKSGPPGGMKQGDTFEHAFDKAGSFAYKCTVHPQMTGTVEVTR